MLDDDADLTAALSRVPGLDVARPRRSRWIDAEVSAAYEADRARRARRRQRRREFQGKAANSDGPVRYTAPSLVFERDGTRLEAGGFQPVEAYDVIVANLDPTLERAAAARLSRAGAGALPARTGHPGGGGDHGAQQRARPTGPPAEDALIDLVGEGRARRVPLGDDALWLAA